MKAESIEQIREHLARGGRVLDHNRDEVDGLGHVCVYYKHLSSIYPIKDLTPEKLSRWELLPIEEEKPQKSFRDSQKERMQRIRKSLLFGHYPSLDDLRDWWQATTGERIEWGRRCNACECTGYRQQRITETVHITVGGDEVDRYDVEATPARCEDCNGSGYTVRPTWMGEEATGDD